MILFVPNALGSLAYQQATLIEVYDSHHSITCSHSDNNANGSNIFPNLCDKDNIDGCKYYRCVYLYTYFIESVEQIGYTII